MPEAKNLELDCSIELSAMMKIFYSTLSNMVATGQMWSLSAWNVPGESE